MGLLAVVFLGGVAGVRGDARQCAERPDAGLRAPSDFARPHPAGARDRLRWERYQQRYGTLPCWAAVTLLRPAGARWR
jgi:hypothetical protein